ncbi:MAG: thermonuclease family protein [Synergistaceae bacterium]|nr:thermonuclease family protein [Synergistaceae bacterium]
MALSAFLALAASGACAVRGTVTEVFDGDTVVVTLDGGGTETVRYLLIDTPELHHPLRGEEELGAEAARLNASLVLGRAVRLERDVAERDRYGRLLAHPWLSDGDGELLVSALLVEAGLALPLVIPPNGSRLDRIDTAVASAREARRGLWGLAWNRTFTADQVWAFLPRLKGRFLRLAVDVDRVTRTPTRWVIADRGKRLSLAFHLSQEKRFPDPRTWQGRRLEVIGKVEAGYRGLEVFLAHPGQILSLSP